MSYLPALLYEDYFKQKIIDDISDNSFQSFFDYIFQDVAIPQGLVPEDSTHKRIYFYFHYYILSRRNGLLRYYNIQRAITNSSQLCSIIKDIINGVINYL